MHVRPTPIKVLARQFIHIHVDLIGPLPVSKGFSYLFTIIDHTTTWVEAVPLSAMVTTDFTQALFKGWITRFGMPVVLTSNSGAQFTSAIWRTVCSPPSHHHCPKLL